MSLRDLFRSAFGMPGQEHYALDEADIPTVSIGGATFNLVDWHPGLAYVETLPAVKRARQMTADTVAKLPAVGFRNGSRLDVQPPLIRRPDPEYSARDFLEETMLSLIDHGNAYWWITFDERRNQPIAAKVVDPSRVTVSWAPGQRSRRYAIDQTPVNTRQIRHLALQRSVTDLTGSGPMQSTRLAGLAYMLRYSQDYFKEASNPSGILTDPWENDPDEAADKLAQWEAGHDRGTRMLTGGLTWTPNTLKPGESDWVNSHAAGYVDIAVLFGIPVPLLGASLLGGSQSIVYQNLTTIYEQWYRDTLNVTYIPRIVDAWTSLLPAGTYVELDADALLRPDLKGRTELATALVEAGIISIEEARDQIGYATAPGPAPNAPAEPNREITA